MPSDEARLATQPNVKVGGSWPIALKNEYGDKLQIPSWPLVLINAIGRGVTAETSNL
jgi:hypothetical protein